MLRGALILGLVVARDIAYRHVIAVGKLAQTKERLASDKNANHQVISVGKAAQAKAESGMVKEDMGSAQVVRNL